ncbi:hypothetical protein [Alicyclobacillus shizuokensis]|uniref:hypothetical protein n=1 Tax=Alicyclobacillus shizuokensis TaxID=392014 RepID=UPI00083061C8|nr:hypothetical protein [Alicyclobacillus shizuokensis]
MDVISLGIASSAYSAEEKMRNQTLGPDVTGSFPNTKSRIDAIDKSYAGVVETANQLIINDAINIMKANAKLNAVAKSMRYKHQNMIFDDLLDANGIDASKSSGYTVDTTNGLVKSSGSEPATIVTIQELADAVPQEAVLVVEESVPAYTAIVPVMTSNTSPAGYVASTNTSTPAYYAFDGAAPEWGTGDSNTTGWVQIDLPSAAKLDKLTLSINNAPWSTQCAPKTFDILGFNPDTHAWETIQSFTAGAWSDNMIQEFTVNSTRTYTSYKLNINTVNGGQNLWVENVGLYQLNTGIMGTYYISRDDGVTWEQIIPEQLFYFTAKSPQDKKIRLKAMLPPDVSLLNYGLTWT